MPRRAVRSRLVSSVLAAVLVLTGAGTIVVGGLLAAAPAHADTVKDKKTAVDKQLADVREDLEGANTDLVKAAVTLQKAQARLGDAQAALTSAQGALKVAERKDAEIASQLAVADAAVTKAQHDLDVRQQQEHLSRAAIGTIAREAYVNSGMSGLSIVLNATSPQQFADQVAVAGTALQQQRGTITRLQVEQAETRTRQVRLDAALALVTSLRQQSAAVVAQRRSAEHKAATAQAQVSALVRERQGAVRVIAKRKAAEKQRLVRLSRQQRKLADVLRARHDGGGTSSDLAGNGRLSHPVVGPITSGFGMRFHPILHIWRLHAGTDFGVPCGTPVHAPAAGTIVRAGWAGGFGNQILIDHGRVHGVQLASSVNHLSRIIRHGGHVHRGQLIGYSGTTGLSTGCHVHFEVYVNGNHVNPMNWL